MRVQVTREARNDLAAIGSWLAQRNPEAARKVLEVLRRRVSQLRDRPLMGRHRPDLAEGLIGLVVNPYLVLYRVDDEDITVVRIIDGRRDLTKLFQD
jgi:toxin ParE1/3/4